MEKLSMENIGTLMDTCYEKAINGIPMVSEPIDKFADEYLKHYKTAEKAAEELIKMQIMKCGTSGFLTGVGGMITLPIAIPANVSSVIYMQLRMIAAVAYIGGWDISDDRVRTLAYVCLTETSAIDILKQAGVKVGQKITMNLIKKIPGAVLININKKVGFRLITKFGQKGILNLGKAVPIVGGVIGSGFDIVSTKRIAKNAFAFFIEEKCNI